MSDNEEVNLKSDFIEAAAPKFVVGNYQFDQVTLVCTIIAFAIIFYLYNISKKMEIVKCNNTAIVFKLTILFFLLQLHNRRNENLTHISSELELKLQARQLNMLLLGSLLIFVSFYKEKLKTEDNFILGIVLILLLVGCFWYNYEDLPEYVRIIRNIHMTCYNVAICIFIGFISYKFLC